MRRITTAGWDKPKRVSCGQNRASARSTSRWPRPSSSPACEAVRTPSPS